MILVKRLSLDGHVVVNATNGQEGLEVVEMDRDFDCVLMDIQYVGFTNMRICTLTAPQDAPAQRL